MGPCPPLRRQCGYGVWESLTAGFETSKCSVASCRVVPSGLYANAALGRVVTKHLELPGRFASHLPIPKHFRAKPRRKRSDQSSCVAQLHILSASYCSSIFCCNMLQCFHFDILHFPSLFQGTESRRRGRSPASISSDPCPVHGRRINVKPFDVAAPFHISKI